MPAGLSGLTSRIIKTRTVNDPNPKAARQRQEPPKRLLPKAGHPEPPARLPKFFRPIHDEKERCQMSDDRSQMTDDNPKETNQ